MKPLLNTASFWMESAAPPDFPALDRPLDVDIVVVGAGITGLTAAYLLTKAGRRVAVIERDRIVERDTAHTTAHLTMVTDEWLSDLVSRFGRDHAQATWDAGLAAIAQIDAIVRAERIDCDFAWVPGYIHQPIEGSGEDPQHFRDEAELASELGFEAAFADVVPLIGGVGVKFERQARFHPRKYLAGVARAIAAAGGQIFEKSAAQEFSDQPLSVKANGHLIRCAGIVLATHTPLLGTSEMMTATLFQTKLALYSTYAIGGRVRRGQVPDALFWDTADPYHYLRLAPQGDNDLVIFGGEDHKTGQVEDTAACYQRLERKLGKLIPGIEVTHHWSGQVIETPDGLPYIGEQGVRQFAATGFAGNGMTFGTLSGMMATDRILGRPNPWRDLFDPTRTKIAGGAWDYIKENKDYPYYMVRDRIARPEAKSLGEIGPGEGKIVELNGKQVAASRRDDGTVTMVSAVCTHMGCLVDWNTAERTWDCPCHGSRFTPDGAVIGGPAESPLPKVAE